MTPGNDNMTSDNNVEIAKLQRAISDHIGIGVDSLMFNYVDEPNGAKLYLITLNPRHNQSFLFHSTTGHNKLEALREMLQYVRIYKDRTSSYTIQWSAKGEHVLNTSYFRAKNVLDALDKLFYDRDPNSITVFSVILNPIS